MKRLLLPDLLKGLAALLMVQIHITELFIDSAGKESVFGKISLFLGGPFAAVVFMIVMGYFIAKNKGSSRQNISRGIKIFILGFLLNIGLNFHLLLKIKFSAWQYNPLEYIFGVDILYLAGMSIVVLAVLKTLKKGKEAAALILLLAICSLTGLLNENLTVTNHFYILPFVAGNYSWSYFPLFPWLAYPLTGFVFAQHEERIKRFFSEHQTASVVSLVVVAVLVILFSKKGISTTINLPEYYHHTFGYVLWALGLTVLWTIFLQFILKLFPSTWIGDFFCRIGKNITLFYVIQWLIIGNVATSVYQNQQISTFWYWFGSIFTVSVLLTFMIEKARTLIADKLKKWNY